MCQTCEGKSVSPNRYFNQIKKHYIKERKKSWEPYRIQQLNSTANSAQFGWKWARLQVLFSKLLPNGSNELFHIFSTNIFKIHLTKHFCPHIFDTYYFSYRCSAHNLQFTVFYIVFRTNYNTQGLLQDAFRNTCYVYI